MLALGSGRDREPIVGIWIDHDLGMELADSACQWHNLKDRWTGVEDPLGGDDYRWVVKPCLTSRRVPEVKLDDVTRGQHRAKRFPRW